MITGSTVYERKASAAQLVINHLQALGHKASLIKNETNSQGHTDRLLVDSSLGIIHITTTASNDPNAEMVTGDFGTGNQPHLAGKAYIAYCWNAKDGRTFLMFVSPDAIEGKTGISKQDITRLRDKTLSTVIAASSLQRA